VTITASPVADHFCLIGPMVKRELRSQGGADRGSDLRSVIGRPQQWQRNGPQIAVCAVSHAQSRSQEHFRTPIVRGSVHAAKPARICRLRQWAHIIHAFVGSIGRRFLGRNGRNGVCLTNVRNERDAQGPFMVLTAQPFSEVWPIPQDLVHAPSWSGDGPMAQRYPE